MRKILSALIGVLSIGVAVFAVWLCVYAEGASVKLDAVDPEGSGEVLQRFFDCLEAEQWDEAYGCLYNYATLGLETAPADELSARFWQAQKDAWAFQMSEDWTQDGVYIQRQATVRGLDMDAVREAISARVQELLAQVVEDARLKSDVYDDNGNYREDVAMAALAQAEDEVLASISGYTKDRTLTVQLRPYDGAWYIEAGKDLIAALTSGAVR